MITYPLTNRDAIRVVMARVPASGTRFICPAIQQFFDDERAGLCAIEVKRNTQVEPVATRAEATHTERDQFYRIQHEVRVRYMDPEMEFEKRLSI